MTWHCQFVHADIDSIKSMQPLVDGLNTTSMKEKGKCEDCIRGKMTAAPHTRPIENEDNFTEGLICTDLWGPSTVRLSRRALYLMLIIDAEVRLKEAYFLPNKEAPTTLTAFNMFHRNYKTQTKKKITRLRIDNEFASANIWKNYCIEHGIHLEPTAPHTSQANGIAERGIGITIADTRTLLIDSGLLQKYWAEAAAFSVYTQNLIPSHCKATSKMRAYQATQRLGRSCNTKTKEYRD